MQAISIAEWGQSDALLVLLSARAVPVRVVVLKEPFPENGSLVPFCLPDRMSGLAQRPVECSAPSSCHAGAPLTATVSVAGHLCYPPAARLPASAVPLVLIAVLRGQSITLQATSGRIITDSSNTPSSLSLPWEAIWPVLHLLFSRLNKPGHISCSSYILSSRPFSVFVVLHWTCVLLIL